MKTNVLFLLRFLLDLHWWNSISLEMTRNYVLFYNKIKLNTCKNIKVLWDMLNTTHLLQYMLQLVEIFWNSQENFVMIPL